MPRLNPLEKLRKLCLALPGTSEKKSHGEPTFWVRGRMFAMNASAETHHGAGRPGVWCNAPPLFQGPMVESNPDRFFVPPYVGVKGWVGVHLDSKVDWDEVAGVLEQAHRMTEDAAAGRSRKRQKL